jgi:hypothetical protein
VLKLGGVESLKESYEIEGAFPCWKHSCKTRATLCA